MTGHLRLLYRARSVCVNAAGHCKVDVPRRRASSQELAVCTALCAIVFLLTQDSIRLPARALGHLLTRPTAFTDLQETSACSGRLKLCPKTRQLTDNLPKYKYAHRCRDAESTGGGGKSGGRADGIRATERLAAGGRESDGGNGGGGYEDFGDRLYSEWEAARRSKPRRQELDRVVEQGTATTTAAAATNEGWMCPKCGGENR